MKNTVPVGAFCSNLFPDLLTDEPQHEHATDLEMQYGLPGCTYKVDMQFFASGEIDCDATFIIRSTNTDISSRCKGLPSSLSWLLNGSRRVQRTSLGSRC